jgi:hypothetical protein
MGFFSAIKKIFTGGSEEEKALNEARARHGIAVDKTQMKIRDSEEKRMAKEYDPWEDLKNYKATFFIGGWAAKKFHVIGEDKVKQKLEELQKKREEEDRKREEKSREMDLWNKKSGEKK